MATRDYTNPGFLLAKTSAYSSALANENALTCAISGSVALLALGGAPCWMQDPRREALLSGHSSGHSEAPRSAAASEALMRRT
ncbi:MAG: hypothetical protein DUD39_12965 [Coriobacteriaceae bacterium]|nr:MAG: hypothetical protein DUD39_12965 [Coriobacteriaceae bacterium]